MGGHRANFKATKSELTTRTPPLPLGEGLGEGAPAKVLLQLPKNIESTIGRQSSSLGDRKWCSETLKRILYRSKIDFLVNSLFLP